MLSAAWPKTTLSVEMTERVTAALSKGKTTTCALVPSAAVFHSERTRQQHHLIPKKSKKLDAVRIERTFLEIAYRVMRVFYH